MDLFHYPDELDQLLRDEDKEVLRQLGDALTEVGQRFRAALTYRDLKLTNELLDRLLPNEDHLA